MSLLQRKFDATPSSPGTPGGAAAWAAGKLTRVAAAQRIRLGVTGLAAIFLLLVVIAAAGLRPGQSPTAQDTLGEPLAVLGVAPGAGAAALARDAGPKPPVVRPRT